jgi:hypothetical protein
MAENTTQQQFDPNKPLTQQEALGILIQAANLAQSKGVFNLDEAALVKKAKDVFAPPAAAPKKDIPAEKPETETAPQA